MDSTSTRTHRPVLPSMRILLVAFSLLTFLAVVALAVRPDTTDRYFAWTIKPPITAGFLGAAYAAGCVLVVLSLRARTWAHARASIVTILVFTVLTLLATVLHLDRFHFGEPGVLPRAAAWFWLAVYVVVPLVMVALLRLQQRAPGSDPPQLHPMPRWLAAALAVEGGVLFVVGALLFAVPATAEVLWPWTLSSLTAQAVGAWLVAFGVAAALALRERDLRRLRTSAVAYLTFGVAELLMVLRLAGDVRWSTPAAWLYVVMLVAIALTGAAGLVLLRQASPAQVPRPG